MAEHEIDLGREKKRKFIDAVLRTEAGKDFFAYLHNECGYSVSSLVLQSDGEVAKLSTECQEAQRRVYIQLRDLADPDLRAVAEARAEKLLLEQPESQTKQPEIKERKK